MNDTNPIPKETIRDVIVQAYRLYKETMPSINKSIVKHNPLVYYILDTPTQARYYVLDYTRQHDNDITFENYRMESLGSIQFGTRHGLYEPKGGHC